MTEWDPSMPIVDVDATDETWLEHDPWTDIELWPVVTASETARPSRSRKLTLYCAERFAAMAEVAADSLTVRDWDVRVVAGTHAKRRLARSMRRPEDGLRILCVAPERMPDSAPRLRRALDPRDRGDLLVIGFETPRHIVDAVEQFEHQRARWLAGPETRAFVEPSNASRRAANVGWRWALAGAAVAVVMTGALFHVLDGRRAPAVAPALAQQGQERQPPEAPILTTIRTVDDE